MSIALDALILATGWAHVLLAPYTKVEESFNLHATHDVLMYGLAPSSIKNYDHNIFPGAVPRTFIGSILLAWVSSPIIHLASSFGFVASKFDLQIIVRLVLSSLNAIGLSLIRRAVHKRFGRLTGFLYTLLTISQFHIPFWMGRTLPNMFALLPVNIAFYLILDRAPHATRPSPSRMNIAIALLTAAAVIFRSELVLLLGPLVLQWLWQGYISFWGVVRIGFPGSNTCIMLNSLVKYLRVSQPKSNLIGRIAFGAAFGMIMGNLLATVLLATTSIANYPGGEALASFNEKYPSVAGGKAPHHVHICNLAAQTGASLFLQEYAPPFHPSTPLYVNSTSMSVSSKPNADFPWTEYDKTENLAISALSTRPEYTHLISEASPSDMEVLGGKRYWKEVGNVNGFDRWSIDWELLKGLKSGRGIWNGDNKEKGGKADLMERIWGVAKMRKSEKLWIYERK